MTDSHATDAAGRASRLRDFWSTIESTASVFFAFVVGFVLVLAGGVIVYLTATESDDRWLILVVVPVVVGEIISLTWLKGRLEGPRASRSIPSIALGQLDWPLVTRPVIAAWWLVHAAPAVAALVALEKLVPWHDLSASRLGPQLLLVGFAIFTISHTSHLYVMLAVATVRRSPRLIHGYWRWRFAIDLSIMTIGGLWLAGSA
jgi:hypothetical protein